MNINLQQTKNFALITDLYSIEELHLNNNNNFKEQKT